jgi:hypothetical protein
MQYAILQAARPCFHSAKFLGTRIQAHKDTTHTTLKKGCSMHILKHLSKKLSTITRTTATNKQTQFAASKNLCEHRSRAKPTNSRGKKKTNCKKISQVGDSAFQKRQLGQLHSREIRDGASAATQNALAHGRILEFKSLPLRLHVAEQVVQGRCGSPNARPDHRYVDQVRPFLGVAHV